MSNWEVICRNRWWNEFEKFYTSPYFPMEVRGMLATWLEKPGQEGTWNLDEARHQSLIDTFVRQTVEQLALKCMMLPRATEQDCYRHIRLSETIKQIQCQVSSDSIHMFRIMKQSLQNEHFEIQRLLHPPNHRSPPSVVMSRKNSPTYGMGTSDKSFFHLDKEVMDILHDTELSSNATHKMILAHTKHYKDLRNEFSKLYKRQTELGLPSSFNAAEIQNNNQTMNNIQAQFSQAPVQLRQMLEETKLIIGPLQRAHATSTSQIQEFREEQRLLALGKEPEMDPKAKLDKIDAWYDKITNCIAKMQESLEDLRSVCENYAADICGEVQNLSAQLTNLHHQMIKSSFVIQSQPNPIIKTKTKFGPIVLRVLTCSKNMMVEKKVQTMLTNDASGNSAKVVGTLERGKGCLSVKNNIITFKKALRVFQLERTTRRGEKNIVEEQFYINFAVSVNIDGESHTLWTRSHPLIIITHPSQTGDAMATVIWFNALQPHERTPFSQHKFNPPNVSWDSLIKLIDLQFKKAGKGLSEGNKAHLKTKLFRGNPEPNDMVSYDLFCETNKNAKDDPQKDKFLVVDARLLNKYVPSDIIKSINGVELENGSKIFSFWTWVWSFLELLNPPKSNNPEDPKQLVGLSLKRLWKDDNIVGFISKEETLARLNAAKAELLQDPTNHYPSPFLLRFPDNRPDAIGMYFLHGDNNRLATPHSYTTKDLKDMPIDARILGCRLVTHLEPAIKKEDAFTRTPIETEVVNGYFMPKVTVQEYLPSHILSQFKHFEENETSSSSSSSVRSEGTTQPASPASSVSYPRSVDNANPMWLNQSINSDDSSDDMEDEDWSSDCALSSSELTNLLLNSPQRNTFEGIDPDLLREMEIGN